MRAYILAIFVVTMAFGLPQKITTPANGPMNDTVISANGSSEVAPATNTDASAITPVPSDDSTKPPESGNLTLPTPGPMMGPPPPHGGPMMGPAPGQGSGGGVMIGPPPLQGGSAIVG